MKSLLIFLIALTSLAPSAQADSFDYLSDQWKPLHRARVDGGGEWHHRSVTSQAGDVVNLHYQLTYRQWRSGYDLLAYYLYIEVDPAYFERNANVKAVLIGVTDYEFHGRSEEVQVIDLHPSRQAGIYRAETREVDLGFQAVYPEASDVYLEVAIVVNDFWLVDPVTGRHNFRPDLLGPVRR